MVKHTRKTRRGGYWSINPMNWGKPEPLPTIEPPSTSRKSWWQFWKKDEPVPPPLPMATSTAPTPAPSTPSAPVMGGKKRKTRRAKGGRRMRSRSRQIYGH